MIEQSSGIVFTVLVSVLFAGGPIAMMLLVATEGRRLNSSRAARRYATINAYINDCWSRGLVGVFVTQRYQDGERGSKAIITLPDGKNVDAWFWWYHPVVGGMVFITYATGSGPHAQVNDVHCVGTPQKHGVHGVVKPRDVRFRQRYLDYQAKKK